MKIALFTDTFLPQINGVTKTLEKLLDYFEKEGIEYLLFAPEGEEIHFDYHVETIPSFNFFLYPECKLSLPKYFKIKDILTDFDPDLIHLVTPFNLGLCGLRYAKKFALPIVASYHTNFDQYLAYYKLNFLKKPIWKFFNWFHKHSQLNLVPSQITLENLRRNGIKNLKIWDRGIDTQTYSPDLADENFKRRYGIEGKTTILYVGRLAPEKNLELLLASLEKLNKKYKDEIELLITGSGPMIDDLKAKAAENVTFTGYLTGDELAMTYASCDIFAFPSVTETYGNVILEAMASGLPVVGILAGGVKENLFNEQNGLACLKNNVKEFSQNLKRLITNQSLRKKLASNARKYALNKSWEQAFSSLIVTYQQVIEYNQEELFSA